MSKLKYVTVSEDEVVLSIDAPAEVQRLSKLAWNICNPNDEALTFNELNALIDFAKTELNKAAISGASWWRSAIDNGDIHENELVCHCTSPEEYIAIDGPVSVLSEWLFRVDNAADWDKMQSVFPNLSQANILAAFALLMIDQSLEAMNNADINGVLENMAIAGDALNSAGFNNGWEAGKECANEERKKQARAGGVAKNRPFLKLKAWTLQQYKDGNYPSRHKASFDLAPAAIAKAKEFGTSLSQQRAQQTIYEWLRNAA